MMMINTKACHFIKYVLGLKKIVEINNEVGKKSYISLHM
jgi:hypothetical protein